MQITLYHQTQQLGKSTTQILWGQIPIHKGTITVPISIPKLAIETLLQQNDPRNLSLLEEIESDKYLGIHLYTDLFFNTHTLNKYVINHQNSQTFALET